MPRTGGEADKLGNRFEGIWMVDSLIDVFAGDARAVTPEPLGKEALGIEFIKETNEGRREFHSAKRQTDASTWTFYKLTRLGENGRSILGDLFGKLAAADLHDVRFVSATSAQDLSELTELARKVVDAPGLKKQLDERAPLKEGFINRVLLLAENDETRCFAWLQRTRVTTISEPELISRLEQKIRLFLYEPDGPPIDPVAVRLLLADQALLWLGELIDREKWPAS